MRELVRITALCVSAFLLAATAAAETLVIPGSGNPEYVLAELARVFNSQQKQHQIVIPSTTGTAGALRDIKNGSASVARVGRILTEAERSGGLTYYPLGRDPVAFVGGAAVSARSLTRSQIVDIYTGKLSNWRDLGGKPAPIRAIGREATDASHRAISQEIKAFAGMEVHESVKIVHLDPQVIELLDRFPTSIGFLNRSALRAAKTNLVMLALDSVEPTAESLKSGRYPLWLEFGLIYKESSLTAAGRAFLKFIESPAGVGVLLANGVLPAAAMP